MSHYHPNTSSLRDEIAILAARLIAEEGLNYENAKKKAVRQLFGQTKINRQFLPDNKQVEEEVRQYLELFHGEDHKNTLRELRNKSLQLLRYLAQFNVYLTGAVLNGSATQHSPIQLQIFTDSAKDVEIFLLNANIPFEVEEPMHLKAKDNQIETIHFFWQQEEVYITIFNTDDIRQNKSFFGPFDKRVDEKALKALLSDSENV